MNLSPFRFLSPFFFFVIMIIAVSACGSSDSDDDTNDSADDDTASDDTVDDDTASQEQLYAAAGAAVITPTDENHPETVYLGGIIPTRVSTGVHDDLNASALALRQGRRSTVIVSLDFLGFSRSRIREIQERIFAEKPEIKNILIASTHTHEGPDTLGVFGPNFLTSGVSPEYMEFVQNAIAELILDVWERLEPVTMKAATTEVNVPGSNYPDLMADLREPQVTVDWLSAASFTASDGSAVATLVNWHAHPEVMIESTLVSSDFPGYLRSRVRDVSGGECVYISGAVGGLATPTGVDVPALDENGDPILDDNDQQVFLRDGTYEKSRSLGFFLADLAMDALNDAEDASNPQLDVTVRQLLLPVTGPAFVLGFLTHLIEFDSQDLVTDQPDFCGWLGCSDDRIARIRLGPLEIISSPGETFPETLIGRQASDYDYGEPYGTFHFEAMTGIQDSMTGEVPMLMSVCENEMAYPIPASDWHYYGHPDHYEEDLCFGPRAEGLYRQAAIDLLTSN